jgi:hypothetical protein
MAAVFFMQAFCFAFAEDKQPDAKTENQSPHSIPALINKDGE